MKPITIGMFMLVLIALLASSLAHAQVSCAQFGAFTSCDGPRGQHTDQLRLSPTQGVLTDAQGHLEPYTIFPSPQPSRSSSDALLRMPTVPPVPYFDEPKSYHPSEPASPLFLPGFGGEAGQ